jgi:hypothetical protein
MEKKVFSVKDGTLIWDGENIFIAECKDDDVPIATTFEADTDSVYILPSSLIRKQPSDEELADGYAREMKCDDGTTSVDFLSGRKSFGDKVYSKEDMISFAKWLQKEDTETNAESWFHYTDSDIFEYWLKEVHTKCIYPHTIEVMHDGNNYLWETLKAEY